MPGPAPFRARRPRGDVDGLREPRSAAAQRYSARCRCRCPPRALSMTRPGRPRWKPAHCGFPNSPPQRVPPRQPSTVTMRTPTILPGRAFQLLPRPLAMTDWNTPRLCHLGATTISESNFCGPNHEPHRLLFADYFYQHPLGPAPVELAVEYPLPRSEIEPPFGDRNHHLAPHHLPFMMGVAIVLAGAIMMVPLWARIVRRDHFEPSLVILMQSWLIVVDKNRRRDMHRVDQAQTFAHAA